MMPRSRSIAACVLALSLLGAPVSAIAETSDEVRAEVASVQAELDELSAQIDAGESQIQELQGQIDSLADQSVEIQGKLIEDRRRLSQMISNSYKDNADARVLALLLSSESMDELVSQVYYAQKVSDWQADCIARLNEDKQELDLSMAQISSAKDQQKAMLDELAPKRDELNQKVSDLSAKASQLEESERAAARAAAEAAAQRATAAQAQRDAQTQAVQQALASAAAAGDVPATATRTSSGGSGWITCIASAYSTEDNDPPGSNDTASGIPLDDSVPTVAMPMSMNPSSFYGSRVEISYNGMSVIATVTDCGYMGGGSRGLDLTPAVFNAFGFNNCDDWGLREVSYRFI